jgi:2-iminoacetate synthase
VQTNRPLPSEAELLQVIFAYRLLLPFANITISTRERAHFRDHVIGLAATKISAGVSTGIGGHQECSEEVGDDQFEIADTRSVNEVYLAIKERGLQPVMNDYVYV